MCIPEFLAMLTKIGEKLIGVFHSKSAIKQEIKLEERLKIKADVDSVIKQVSYMLIASDDSIKIKVLQAISPLLTCEIKSIRIAAREFYECIDNENGFNPNTEKIKCHFNKFIDECNKSIYGTRKTSPKA